MLNRHGLVICFAIITVLLGGCKPGPDDLDIVAYGPEKVLVGKEFNRQPNGSNALWIKARNAAPTTVVVLAKTKLNTTVLNNGTFVTALVPPELTKAPGDFVLYLLDSATGKKSREAVFSVLPDEGPGKSL